MPPSDALLASSDPLHSGVLETAVRRRSLAHSGGSGASAHRQSRLSSDGAVLGLACAGLLHRVVQGMSLLKKVSKVAYRIQDGGGPSSAALNLFEGRPIVCRS